jgi:nucleoside-diphosphate-sugar epimerase
MRIIVIGGTRFIGPHVVTALAGAGHDVIVFHRGESEHVDTPVRHIHGDRAQLPNDLHGDLVIDMWCMTEEHARGLVDHFRNERLVVISSGDVYRQYSGLRGVYAGPPDPVPLSEEAPLRESRYPYRFMSKGDDLWWSYDKILVERVAVSDRTTILRLAAVYGPNDEQHRFANWLGQMDSGASEIAIDNREADWRWTRGYVENVADAIVLAAANDKAAGKTYNVGESDAATQEEWLRRVAGTIGWNGAIVRTDNPPGTLALQWDRHLVTDTRAIRSDLGYNERISREEALARTLAWERHARRRGF